MEGIEPQGKNFHAYARLDQVGSLSLDPGVNYDEVNIRHAVPFGDQDGILIQSGSVSRINLPLYDHVGSVITLINPASNSIINITRDDHLLSYAIAVRQVVIIGDGIYIRTIGVGNNTNLFLSIASVAGSGFAFSQSTAAIFHDIQAKK